MTIPNFRSQAEANVAKWLTKRKIKWEFETVKLPYLSGINNGKCLKCLSKEVVQQRMYLPDFWLPDLGFYLEVKGRLDSPTRKKMRDIKKTLPQDIRLFLLADNKIKPSKPERYSDWCKKFDYTYCVKTLNEDWFK